MRSGNLAPFGSDGGIVEVDETFIGTNAKARAGKVTVTTSHTHKMKVLSLIERNTGSARSFVIDHVRTQDIDPILAVNLAAEVHLMTDELRIYRNLGPYYAAHSAVNHGKGEYVNRFNPIIHTNTVEGFFSVFKRGMKGVYQHCAEKHLHRYVAEFDFRYTNRVANGYNDTDRADALLAGIVGKPLTYQRTNSGARA
jgi:hypothetical protein